MKRAVVGLSGGVDSSVAAYLLKKQGYEVIGIFMKNWHDDSVTISDECPWIDDSNDAMMVAQKLDIPFQTIDFSKEYKERIVDYMFREYEMGRTPNPDVLCNREIKFDSFLKTALRLKADYVATGHYCRKVEEKVGNKTIYKLLAGKDTQKDQSYFLCQLNQSQLRSALFPIGELTKPEVRKIAKEIGLVTADKKDSQGLCFVGKVHLPDFLQQQLSPKEGNVINISPDFDGYNKNGGFYDISAITSPISYTETDGVIVGKHKGAHYYTIGQRKGLNIGGFPEPLFIIDTDTTANAIYTGMSENHPGLFRKGLFVENEDIHWVRNDLRMEYNTERNYKARIRYRQNLQECTLHQKENGLYIIFEKEQKAITPGQFVAWYDNEELIGSGVIH